MRIGKQSTAASQKPVALLRFNCIVTAKINAPF